MSEIKINKWYKSWKDFCDKQNLDYKKYGSGSNKINLLDELSENYQIKKDGWKIKFINKDNDNDINNLDEYVEAKEAFNTNHSDLSKFFQASLINYMYNKIENENKAYMCMSLSYMQRAFKLTDGNLNSKLKSKHSYNRFDETYIDGYRLAIRQNANRLFVSGLDNLKKYKIIDYNKGFSIGYQIVTERMKLKDKYLKNEDLLKNDTMKVNFYRMEENELYKYDNIIHEEKNDVYARENLASAILSGHLSAWVLMCEIFGFNNKYSMNDVETIEDLSDLYNINYGQLFNEQGAKWFKKNNKSVFSKFNYLSREKIDLLIRFFNTDMNYYSLYRKFCMIEIADYMQKHMYKDLPFNRKIKVKYFYTAYEIIMNEHSIMNYRDTIIKSILTDTPVATGKKLNLNYMTEHVYNKVDRQELIDKKTKNNEYYNGLSKKEKEVMLENEIIKQVINLCYYMIYPDRISKNNMEQIKQDIFKDVIDKLRQEII